jgi:hypothetical protein
MAKKLKGHANPLAELHFIANMPLEQAVMLIRDLADNTYTITLTEMDADNFKFQIDDTRTHSRASKISGTLQRWQGTETRVDVIGEIIRSSISGKYLGFILALFCFLVVGFFSLADGVRNGIEHDFVYGFPAFVILLLGAAVFRYFQESPEDDNLNVQPIQFRERDRLLQLIIDTFKAAGTVEAYEPSTSVDENIAFLSETDNSQHKAKNA